MLVHGQPNRFTPLFDRHIPGWREDNFSLRYALSIPLSEVWEAHLTAKQMADSVCEPRTPMRVWTSMCFTLGFARRAAAYKRADLLFQDIERLRQIATQVGALQVIYAGKAHPTRPSREGAHSGAFMRSRTGPGKRHQDRLPGQL